jgi:hypothetical protein
MPTLCDVFTAPSPGPRGLPGGGSDAPRPGQREGGMLEPVPVGPQSGPDVGAQGLLVPFAIA